MPHRFSYCEGIFNIFKLQTSTNTQRIPNQYHAEPGSGMGTVITKYSTAAVLGSYCDLMYGNYSDYSRIPLVLKRPCWMCPLLMETIYTWRRHWLELTDTRLHMYSWGCTSSMAIIILPLQRNKRGALCQCKWTLFVFGTSSSCNSFNSTKFCSKPACSQIKILLRLLVFNKTEENEL